MTQLILSTRRPRRFALLVAVAIAAAVCAVILTGSTGHATSGGSAYTVPLAVDTNPDPNILETTLIADETNVDLGNGVIAHALTFNGQIPGPELRLKVGDTVIVHYENHLDHASAIHWHGIELENSADGTPFTQNQVPAGGTFLYKFKVTRPGIYWYHPHHHSSTNQVFKGLYGSIIVTDPNEAPLQASAALPSAANTLTAVLSDVTVCKAVGANDAATYNPALPWVGGGPLPAQAAPTPTTLCEAAPIDEEGAARPAFAAGDIPNIQTAATAGRTNEGQTVLTNGRNVGGRAGTPSAPGALAPGAETLDVMQGQGLRVQFINAATTRHFRLRLTDNGGTQIPLVRVGGEGGLLDNAVVEGGIGGGFDTKYSNGEIMLSPGSRADVAIAIPFKATGVLTLWTEDFNRTGAGFPDTPTVPVMHFKVVASAAITYTIAAGTPLRAATGDPVPTLGPATGSLLDPSLFTPPLPGLAAQNIQLTQTGGALGVDGVFGTHDVVGDYTTAPHLGSSRYAKLGDTLELTVKNTTGAHHPFHLHGFSMQPLDLTKPASPTFTWTYREFRDNIDVPPGYTLRFRIKLDDRPMADGVTLGGGLGRWLFHCHIFFHATNGMLGELVVLGKSGKVKPNINLQVRDITALAGLIAKIRGTWVDGDGGGNPLTFTASLGRVVDEGAGRFSWSYPTTGRPDESRVVYITATDSDGNSDQVAFQLNVVRTPDTTIDAGPPEISDTQEATFAFSSIPAGLRFECAFDSTDFRPCSPPRTYHGLAAGAHSLAVRAVSPLGEIDLSPAARSWTISPGVPDTTITSGPKSPTTSRTAAFSFTASIDGSRFECRLDGGDFRRCSSPLTFHGLALGPRALAAIGPPGLSFGLHSLAVRAVNFAGVADPTPAVYEWEIDPPPTR